MRKEKNLLLDEMKRQIVTSNGSFLIMRYSALKANSANDFRRVVGKTGGCVEVVRKRVFLKAAEAAGITIPEDTLVGHVGLVFTGRDPFETTKNVFKFSQETGQAIEILGGRFEGQMYSGADVEQLSKLPSKNEMRAQLLGTLEAPMSELLAVVDALLCSVVHCLGNKTQNEGSENNH